MSVADTFRTRRSRLGDDGGNEDPEEGRREANPLGARDQWTLWGEAASWWWWWWWPPVCAPVDDISWSIAPFVRRRWFRFESRAVMAKSMLSNAIMPNQREINSCVCMCGENRYQSHQFLSIALLRNCYPSSY